MGQYEVMEGKIGENEDGAWCIGGKNLDATIYKFRGKTVRISITEIDSCAICGEPIVQEVEITNHMSPGGFKEFIMICKNHHSTGKQVPYDVGAELDSILNRTHRANP